ESGIIRVPLKAELMLRRYTGGFQDSSDQPLQVFGREKSGGASAQVNLFYFRHAFKKDKIHFPLFQNGVNVRLFVGMIFCDPFMTGTKSTKTFAIRQMDIQA